MWCSRRAMLLPCAVANITTGGRMKSSQTHSHTRSNPNPNPKLSQTHSHTRSRARLQQGLCLHSRARARWVGLSWLRLLIARSLARVTRAPARNQVAVEVVGG